jgi:hypothetical protein
MGRSSLAGLFGIVNQHDEQRREDSSFSQLSDSRLPTQIRLLCRLQTDYKVQSKRLEVKPVDVCPKGKGI